MSTIQDPRWLATGTCSQFGGKYGLWGQDWGSPLPSGSGCPHLPLCLLQGRGLYAAGQLSFGVRSILCSVSVPGCALETFAENFSLSLLSLWWSLSLGCYLNLAPSDCLQGIQARSLPLRTDDAACTSLPSPARWCWTQASGLLLCWQLWLGVYSAGFFFVCFSPSYVALWDSKTPTNLPVMRISYCVETSPSRLPPQDGSPFLTLLSLFFVFHILSYLLLKITGCLSGRLVSWCIRSCFVEVVQHSNNLLMNLWGRKWSPHPIPLPSWDRPLQFQYYCLGNLKDRGGWWATVHRVSKNQT